MVMVKKGDGSLRFCVDNRQMNERTRKDSDPLPRIDVCLDALAGAACFSTFDLRSGYHHVEMEHCDSDKTTFVSRRGTFKFNVMPFGLCNAPATFPTIDECGHGGVGSSGMLGLLGRYHCKLEEPVRPLGQTAIIV